MLTTFIIVAVLCLTYASIHWILPRLQRWHPQPVRTRRDAYIPVDATREEARTKLRHRR